MNRPSFSRFLSLAAVLLSLSLEAAAVPKPPKPPKPPEPPKPPKPPTSDNQSHLLQQAAEKKQQLLLQQTKKSSQLHLLEQSGKPDPAPASSTANPAALDLSADPGS